MTVVDPRKSGAVDVTVFIPTFNGQTYLDRLLVAVENQDFAGTCEILIIDSGSTDATLEIIRRHPLVRLVEISQSEFGHGRTRNHAAQLARGAYIAYLSHDAIPANKQWLTQLLAPLMPVTAGVSEALVPQCVAVFGKQVARDHCFPSLAYEIEGVFRACGPDDGPTLVWAGTAGVSSLSAAQLFYSDVNSATRTDLLRGKIPYRDLDYSEDLAFARDVLEAGFAKAYQPLAIVEHSNDVSLAEYGPRVFDETLGRRRTGAEVRLLSPLGVAARYVRDVARTTVRMLRDDRYTAGQKRRWFIDNPRYLAKKWMNIRRGSRVNLADTSAIARYSLEKSERPEAH
jgi:rhamnosyltransferase